MTIVSAAIALLSLLTTASAASSLCSDGVSIGYSDVATLAADLVDPDVHAANRGVYTVCPFSQMFMTETLVINQSMTTLQCGEDGSSDNFCYFIGAPADDGVTSPWQVAITDGADGSFVTSVLVSGFEMVGMEYFGSESAANIVIMGSYDETDETQVMIYDCHMYGNGLAMSVGIFQDVDDGSSPPQGMTTYVYDSHFYSNAYTMTGIWASNAVLTIQDCAILYNIGGAGNSMVVAELESELSISTNCFQSQTGSNPYASSTIYVDSTSSVISDGTTYGRGNRFGCSGIFSSSQEGYDDSTFGEGTCEEFTAEQCNYQLPNGIEPSCYDNNSLNVGLFFLFSSTYEYPICPGAIFNETITVVSSDVVINCESNCTVDFGGIPSEQPMIAVVDDFIYGTPVSNVTISGLDFKSFVGVNDTYPVVFGNSGDATISSCQFDDVSAPETALFLTVGESVSMDEIYVENSVSSALFFTGNGTVSVNDSCFVDNTVGMALGVIAGFGEISSIGNHESGTTYLSTTFNCGGFLNPVTLECGHFDAEVCAVSGETSLPVSTPATGAPVASPTSAAPLSTPVTDAPVMAPTSAAPVSTSVTDAPVAAPIAAPVSSPTTSSGTFMSSIGIYMATMTVMIIFI